MPGVFQDFSAQLSPLGTGMTLTIQPLKSPNSDFQQSFRCPSGWTCLSAKYPLLGRATLPAFGPHLSLGCLFLCPTFSPLAGTLFPNMLTAFTLYKDVFGLITIYILHGPPYPALPDRLTPFRRASSPLLLRTLVSAPRRNQIPSVTWKSPD